MESSNSASTLSAGEGKMDNYSYHTNQPLTMDHPPYEYPADDFEDRPLPRTYQNTAWFGAGALIIIGSLLAFFGEIMRFEIFDCIQLLFLLLIGIMVALIDAPPSIEDYKPEFVQDRRENFAKYFAFVVRLTGKGLTLAFAGGTLWTSLLTNNRSLTIVVLGCITSMPVILIGLGTFFFGIVKSYHLHQARLWCRENRTNERLLDSVIGRSRFQSMLNETKVTQFSEHDLANVFRALSTTGSPHKISRDDVNTWVRDPTFTLL